MWIQDTTREDLLSIIQSNRLADRPLRQIQSIYQIPKSSNELQFIWREDPQICVKLPSVIIVENITLRDFFAWTGTYLPQCRPLTAHSRVTTREKFQAVADTQFTFCLGKLETICIGLIVGEAATYIAGQSNINRLSLPAFAGTYSFTMTRVIAGNMLPPEKEKVSELWAKARRLTGQKHLNLNLTELNQAWRIVLSISEQKNLGRWLLEDSYEVLTSACHQILQTGEIGENNWNNLTNGLFEKDITQQLLKGPREERVLQVERALTSICDKPTADKNTRAFIGGYLASRISPGTFDHYELLLPYLPKLPSMLLWYGLCAGLPHDSKLRNFGFGIGRRIIRDAVQEDSLLNRPRCDIALEELEVLSSGNYSAQNPYPRDSGHLSVELLPCVNCTMRNTEVRQSEPSRQSLIQQTVLPEYSESEVRNLLFELDRALKSVYRVRDRISEITGYGEQTKGRGRGKK